jgi:hypothetical protein
MAKNASDLLPGTILIRPPKMLYLLSGMPILKGMPKGVMVINIFWRQMLAIFLVICAVMVNNLNLFDDILLLYMSTLLSAFLFSGLTSSIVSKMYYYSRLE